MVIRTADFIRSCGFDPDEELWAKDGATCCPCDSKVPDLNVGGAVAGLAGGIFYGCVVGGIGAVVLGIVLGTAGVAGGDALGITNRAFALASVVACMAIGEVQGGRKPAPPHRTGRPTSRR